MRFFSKCCFVFLIVTAFFISGCASKHQTKNSYKLHPISGSFFTLQVPSHAKAKTLANGDVMIFGPTIYVQASTQNAGFSGYAYQLNLSQFENPLELDAEVWAREYTLTRWKKGKDGTTVFPVSGLGKLDEDKVGWTQVGPYKAFEVECYGVDQSLIKELYIAQGKTIYGLSYTLLSETEDPLRWVQEDIYALLLGSLELKHASTH